MFADAVATVADYVSGLGLDAAKGHFNRKIDEKKLKKVLKEYIERQEKYNEFASILSINCSWLLIQIIWKISKV